MKLLILTFIITMFSLGTSMGNDKFSTNNYVVFFSVLDNEELIWQVFSVEERKHLQNNRFFLPAKYAHKGEIPDLTLISLILDDYFYHTLYLPEFGVSFIKLKKEESEAHFNVNDLNLPDELKEKLKDVELRQGESFTLSPNIRYCLTGGLKVPLEFNGNKISTTIECYRERSNELLDIQVFLIDHYTRHQLYSNHLSPTAGPHPVLVDVDGYGKGPFFLEFRIGTDSRYFPIMVW